MITRLHRVGATAVVDLMLVSMTSSAGAQQARKEFTFRGRVEQVDVGAKRLTVKNEPIDGWMGAMSMAYKVSNEDVLARLKPGDQITAKVYSGDLTLFDVALVPPAAPSAPQMAMLRLEDLE